MSSLDNVVMSEYEYKHIHASKYHYWWWVVKFYFTHPWCLWRDLWWKYCPGYTISFDSHINYNRRELERWCWDNVGVKCISWDIRIDSWVKDEGYNFIVKFRKGKAKYATQMALSVH